MPSWWLEQSEYTVEIILSSFIEWVEKRFKKHRVLKLFLVILAFSCGFWLAYIEWAAR